MPGQSIISEHDVGRVLDKQLEEDPESCPICGDAITTAINPQHDRKCVGCNTKFSVDRRGEDGQPIPSVEIRTTPVNRIQRQLEQKATERAVFNELGEEQGST